MSSSLDKLVSNFPKESLKYTSQKFKGTKFDLMFRKGIYPCDFMNNFEKCDKTELPSKEQFYSILNDEHISDKDYEHAEKIWKKFKLKKWVNTMTFILNQTFYYWPDVFENFKTDIDMYQFIEKGMKGGTSYIANRYGQANNKYMQNYDKSKPSKYITYLDANNLYGWAMSQYLPTGGFRWMTEREINKTNVASYKENSKKGLIFRS